MQLNRYKLKNRNTHFSAKPSCSPQKRFVCHIATFFLVFASVQTPFIPAAYANPSGGQVVGGSAGISGQGTAQVTVNQTSNRAAINWNDFSVDANERTSFVQPGTNSVAFNRVTGGNASQILGAVDANGTIILANPNGVVFGKGSHVDAAGLVATTHDADTDAFMAGGDIRLQQKAGAPANASVVNEGTIAIHDAGVAALVAPQVRNSGLIVANAGKVTLASGKGATVDLYGDKLVSFAVGDEVSQTITDANGVPIKALVQNDGKIQASGGQIVLTARAARSIVNQSVNVSGSLEADHISQQGGTIILSSGNDAGEASGLVKVTSGGKLTATGGTSGGTIHVLGGQVALEGATLDASGKTGGGTIRIGGGQQGGEGLMRAASTTVDSGTHIKADATVKGKGGSVAVWSDDYTGYFGHISARGILDTGGFAEVSGKHLLDFQGTADLLANGGAAGTLLLDPENVTIQTSAGTPAITCTAGVCSAPGDTSILTVATLQTALGLGNVEINTGSTGSQNGDITFANNVTWSNGNLLLVDAYRNITINSGVTISNTYAGSTFGAGGGLPIVLALRADATGINNGGSVTNNGTIDMSASTGAVSIFYDRGTYGGTYTAGTQTANAGWTAPANQTVAAQFRAYQLDNTLADISAIGSNSSGNFAIGKNIAGGGAAISVIGGTFTGIFDGQYCALAGGSYCSVTGITLSPAATVAVIGLFNTNGGTVRNLNLGLDITSSYTSSGANFVSGSVAATNNGTIANVTSTGSQNIMYSGTGSSVYVGGIAGINAGTIINSISQTGTMTVTNTVADPNTSDFYIGGISGRQNSGTVTGSSSSEGITFNQKTANTGAQNLYLGGLVGYNFSGTNTVSNSSASNALLAQYFDNTYSGGALTVNIGGLVGRNGNTAVNAGSITGSTASGSIIDYLSGGTQNLGGLVGINIATSSVASSNTSTAVTYNGDYAVNIGGLVGNNQSSISQSNATGTINDTFTGALNRSHNVGGLVGSNSGSISNASAQTGEVKVTDANTANIGTFYLGGLVGQNTGTIADSTASENVTYTDKGTTAGTNVVYLGGLIGYNNSVATTSVSGVTSAAGTIIAQYFSASYTDSVSAYLGGMIGQNGNNNAVALASGLTATGDVRSYLGGGNEYVGGFTGYNYSSSALSGLHATGATTYDGNTAVNIGGLIGYNRHASSSIAASDATGSVTATSSVNGTINAGGLIGNNLGTVSGSHTQTGQVKVYETNASNIETTYEGGLLGRNAGSVDTSWSSEAVNFIYKGTGSSANIAYVGGLIGYNLSTINPSVTTSYAMGAVSADYDAAASGMKDVTLSIGGLIGRNTGTALNKSYASGSVATSLNGTTAPNLGGLIGFSSGAIADTYSVGRVSYTGSSSGALSGGLIGQNTSTATTSFSTGYVTGAGTLGGLIGGGTGTAPNSYFDIGTAGPTGSTGGTGISTSALQSSLQSGWSGTTWGIAANLYPYLNWQFGSTPQAISGTAYSDRGVTGLAGVEVAGLMNGTALSSVFTGGTAYTGANGYYYYLLNPSTLAAGSKSLMYLTGATKGNVEKNTTGTNPNMDIYANYLHVVATGGNTTLSNKLSGLSGALGSNSGSNFLFTLPSGNLTMASGANLQVDLGNGTVDLDVMPTMTGGGTLAYNAASGATITQSVALTPVSLLLLGAGATYTLTNSSNNIATLAASTSTSTINLNNGANDLIIGSAGGTSGVTADNLYLQTTGNVTETGLINATTLQLLGSTGHYALTAGANNVGTLAANTNYVNLRTDANNLAIGSVNGTNGVTVTNALRLSATGTTTQSQAISAPTLVLSGGTGTFTLTNSANTFNTLAAGVGTGTINIADSTGFDIGTAQGTTGLSAANAYLSSTGTVTQSQALAATNLLLAGTGGSYTLNNSGNAITTLAANTGTVNFTENSSFDIGAVNSVNGITATHLNLSSTGTVTQSQAINVTDASFAGTGGVYTLSGTSNSIGTYAANVANLTLSNFNAGTSTIGSVNGINGLTATTVASLSIGGNTLNQTQAVNAPTFYVTGHGYYNLASNANNIGTLATNSAGFSPITFNLDNGANNLSIGTVVGHSGASATNFYLADTGTVTQSQALTVTNLLLAGAGATYTLTNSGNTVTTLAANTGTLNLATSGGFDIGAVNSVNGITATNAYLSSTGAVTQSQALAATNLLLAGTGGSYTFTNTGNAITTLAANTDTVNLNNGSTALTIGTVNSVDGVTATNFYLATTGGATATKAITASNVALSGASTFSLTGLSNAIGTLAANMATGNIYLDNGTTNLSLGTVNGINGITSSRLRIYETGTVSQTQALNVGSLDLERAGTFTLTNTSNNVGTLVASAAGGTVNLNNGANNLLIGSLLGVNGVTASNAYLSTTGTVTQSQAVTAANLLLSGAGGTYTLTNAGNAVTTLAANTGTVNLNNGANTLGVGTVNTVNGVTASNLYLSDTGTVTQSQALSVTNLLLAGAGGSYTLGNTGNAVTTLAANTGSVSLGNGTHDLTVGAVNSVNGIIGTGAVAINTTGGITLNRSVTAGGTGTTLTLAGNSFHNNAGSTALDAGSGRFLVWSADPASDSRGGLGYNFKQYNATYGSSTVLGTGNGFLYTLAPTLTASLTGSVSKTYDGTRNATLTGSNYSVSGAVDGDTAALNNPASSLYDTKDAGMSKNVAVSGITASATNGAATVYGYQVNSTANANIGAVTAKSLTVNGSFTAQDKTYDGTRTATIAGNSLGLVGVVAGDTSSVSLSAAAQFADKNAASSKTVSLANTSALSGSEASNYSLDLTGSPTTLASIIAKALSITGSFTAQDKIYDGARSATIASNSLGLSGVVAGDTGSVSLSAAAQFTDKNAASGKTVALNTSSLSGSEASNYSIDFTGAPTTLASITAKALSVTGSFTAQDKTYDGTRTATIASNSLGLSGVVAGDTSSVSLSAAAQFSDKNAATGKTVSLANASSLSGAEAGNYSLDFTGSPTTLASITAKALSVTGSFTAQDKTYDGTRTATIASNSLGLSGVVAGDTSSVSLSAAVLFSDKNAANGKTVSLANTSALSGSEAGNYSIDLTGAPTTTASIAAKSLTVNGSFTAQDKTYDGVRSATIATNSLGLSGVVAGDTSSVSLSAAAQFADKNAASGKTVSLANTSALSGSEASNYSLDLTGAPTTLASITAKALSVTGSFTAQDKTYDGTRGATIASNSLDLSGVVAGDTSSVSLSAAAQFADKNAANNKTVSLANTSALSGSEASNYSLDLTSSPTTLASITAKALSVTGAFTAQDKTYDGTRSATIATNSLGLSGVVAGDTSSVSLSAAAQYSDKNAATSKTVSLNTSSLSGSEAGNYILDFTGAPTTTASIAAKSLTVNGSFTAQDKAYNGTRAATFAMNGLGLVGVVAGDVGSVTLVPVLLFDTKDKGTSKTVSVASASLSGGEAGNYSLSLAGVPTATANIFAKLLTVAGSFTAQDKTYDGTTGVAIGTSNLTLSGVVAGDTGSVNLNPVFFFNTRNQGINSVLLDSGSSLSGTEAGNYSLSLTGAPTASASIFAKLLTIGGSFTAQDKVYDGTNHAVILNNQLTVDGVITGENVMLDAAPLFDIYSVGSQRLVRLTGSSLSGIDRANYALNFTGAPVAYANILDTNITPPPQASLETLASDTVSQVRQNIVTFAPPAVSVQPTIQTLPSDTGDKRDTGDRRDTSKQADDKNSLPCGDSSGTTGKDAHSECAAH